MINYTFQPYYDKFFGGEIVAHGSWEDRKKAGKLAWDTYIAPLLPNAILVKIEPLEQEKLRYFADQVTQARNKEHEGKPNTGNRNKRDLGGFTIEFAGFKFYGKLADFDFEVAAKDADKNYPDFLRLKVNCGIKGSKWENVPLVRTDAWYPNIIGVTDEAYQNVWFLGVLTPEISLQYMDDNLFVQNDQRESNKSGFWGFEHLKPLPLTWEELVKLYGLPK